MHDFQQGIRQRISANMVAPRLSSGGGYGSFTQHLVPQDVLTIEQTGSGTGGQIETGSILVWYDNLPGINGRFIDCPTLQKYGVNQMNVEVTITTLTTGGYSGQVAVNSSTASSGDNWKANTDYALMGITTDVRCCTVRIQGVDTGNLGVGVPGEYTMQDVQADWFLRLASQWGKTMIPVFNSANKNAILVDAVSQQVAVTAICTLQFVELAAGSMASIKV
jgi:hypothetical protein